MLAIDWLGCLATAGALLLLYRGKWGPLRAMFAVALGEVGRVAAALVALGPLHSVTVGGAFSGMDASPAANLSISTAGLWVAAFLAIPLGKRLRRDLLLYALAGTAVIFLLS